MHVRRVRAWFGALAVSLAVAGSVVGRHEANAHPWQRGEPHRCPSGAPASSCFYPPDLHAQRFAYSVNGLLLGLALAGVLMAAWTLVRPLRTSLHPCKRFGHITERETP
jgi:hypothetical protein